MAKSDASVDDLIAEAVCLRQQVTRAEREEASLKKQLERHVRSQRTHRLARLGGHIEAHVGRPLTDEEADLVGGIARVMLRDGTARAVCGAQGDLLLGAVRVAAEVGHQDWEAARQRGRAEQ